MVKINPMHPKSFDDSNTANSDPKASGDILHSVVWAVDESNLPHDLRFGKFFFRNFKECKWATFK
jgi:hypothetical protein